MSLSIKRKTLSLSDEISPLCRFINARKELKFNYLKGRNNTLTKNKNNKIQIFNSNKKKEVKKPALKTHSMNLLKDQIFILSHFSKHIPQNEINYDYNTSLLNTFGNRNFFKKNNEKMNIKLISNFINNNNFFKTTAINYSKKRNNFIQKQKSSFDKINLPKLNLIVRKNTKVTKL